MEDAPVPVMLYSLMYSLACGSAARAAWSARGMYVVFKVSNQIVSRQVPSSLNGSVSGTI